MKAKHVIREGGQASLALLRLTSASADAFPPLKAAAGGALHIAELVIRFKSNTGDWAAFGQHVRDCLAIVISSLPDTSISREDLKRNIKKLQETLERIDKYVQDLQNPNVTPVWKRAWEFTKDPEKITSMKEELKEALSLFQLGSSLTTSLDIAKLLKGEELEQLLKRAMNKLNDKIEYLVLNTLPYVDGASWDPDRICYDNTRTALLKEIMDWVSSVTTTAEIFWLTDVAGAGKSAIAHTIAQHYRELGMLASCFFFDREVEGRNRPKLLFSTIAHDLARLDVKLAEKISLAIEGDRSLPTAPISRQFKELIFEPSLGYSGDKPVVIVIDALDEGFDIALLRILRDESHKLPKSFRVFLTSRPETEINFYLSSSSHIRRRALNIHGHANQIDIASYVRLRLQDVAERKHLGADWPGMELCNKFIEKADGLFLWVSTVISYLQFCHNPDNQLKWLLAERNQSDIPVGTKMSKLYSDILSTCSWRDRDFVAAYRLVIGTIVAAKTPLSLSALQSLLQTTHPTLNVYDTVAQVGALFTGWMDQHQPIRIIHLSFRDFVITHAQASPVQHQFYIDEIEHSQELALLCLIILHRELERDIPGTGYIGSQSSTGISELAEIHILEVLWYACRFWTEHLIAVTTPGEALINAMHTFLSRRLVRWVEISTSKGQFQKMDQVRRWLLKHLPEDTELVKAAFSPNVAESLDDLSCLLSDIGRPDEALEASEEAVDLYRQLAKDRPADFTSDLATSLYNLSNRLSHLGRRKNALQTIEEAVSLYRQLALDSPATFTPDLSDSIDSLSLRLSDLGCREEALQTIQEAVTLRRQLAKDNPAAFKPDLAESLDNLSCHLYDVGRPEEALESVEEAVMIYRQLAGNSPSDFNSDLATSLDNLSCRLSDLGRQEEALQFVEEAVMLYRQLAKDRPVLFNSDLAVSLDNLARLLSDLKRPEEALQYVEEAVLIYRKLARDCPAAYIPSLADSLDSLSCCLSDLGRREEAVKSVEEAVLLYRQLAKDHPMVFNPDLAESLDDFSSHLSDTGRKEEALQMIEEAVALRRPLAKSHPAAFNADLAKSLDNLSLRLSDLDRDKEAIHFVGEAVLLFKQLARDRPVVFNSDLAMSLDNLSRVLSRLGRKEEALQSIEGAVVLYKQLANDRPMDYNSDLAASLYNHSCVLSDLDREEEALRSVEEAVVLYRRLSKDNPEDFSSDLADCLDTLSSLLSDLGREEEAIQITKEAVELL